MFGFLRERKRRNEGLALLREAALRGLQDNKLDSQDLAEVNRIETEYGLSSKLAQETLDKVRVQHGSAVLKRETEAILADGRYDDEEERRLIQLLADLGMALPPDVKAVLAKAKQFYQIETGNAPEVLGVGINLTRGERCHFRGECVWHEERSRTRRVNYAGATARIRICKGVYYRVGSMQLEPIREEYVHTVDQGELYITSKRVVFHGGKKNSTIRLNKILAVRPYTDAIVVEKESGKNPIFVLHEPELAAVVLGAMLNNV